MCVKSWVTRNGKVLFNNQTVFFSVFELGFDFGYFSHVEAVSSCNFDRI